MDLVANLLAFVADDLIRPFRNGTLNDVREIAMQLNSGVPGAGDASCSEHTYRHLKVSAKLLAEHVRSHLRRTEQRVQALINVHRLGNPLPTVRILISGFQLGDLDKVRTVAIDFVCAREAEWRFRTEIPSSHQQV